MRWRGEKQGRVKEREWGGDDDRYRTATSLREMKNRSWELRMGGDK